MVDRRTALLVLLMFASLAQGQPAPEPPSAGTPSAAPAAPPADAAVTAPPAAEAAASRGSLLETHIEQVKRGNRVTEVRVTGAEGQRRYTMENPEGRPPSQFQGPGSGLSTPNFLNIEF